MHECDRLAKEASAMSRQIARDLTRKVGAWRKGKRR